jgi:hypothetical protein
MGRFMGKFLDVGFRRKVISKNKFTGSPPTPNSGGARDSEAPRIGGWGLSVEAFLEIA